MSPIDDGSKRIFRDEDSIFRDERGLLHMSHVAVFYAINAAAVTAIAGIVAVFMSIDAGSALVTTALGLMGAAAGLEGWQTHIEGRNQRGVQ